MFCKLSPYKPSLWSEVTIIPGEHLCYEEFDGNTEWFYKHGNPIHIVHTLSEGRH